MEIGPFCLLGNATNLHKYNLAVLQSLVSLCPLIDDS